MGLGPVGSLPLKIMSELTEKQHRLANTDEVANLDVLRSVAVLSVFFAHLYNHLHPGYSNTAWHFGQLGVLAFFVHTSLVLMFSLERQERSGLPIYSTFYIRRFFRLYPLSILFVTLAALGTPGMVQKWTMPQLLTNLTLTQNLFRQENMVGALWTLPLEVQMYVVLPFLFVFLWARKWSWVVALILASIPLAFVAILGSDRLGVLAYVPCFLGGVLAWKLSRTYAPIFPGWLWPVGLAAVSLIWCRAINLQPYDTYLRWVFCVSLGAIIPMFHSLSNSPFTRVAAIVAKYSYGIYLSHVMVMDIAFKVLRESSPILQWGTFTILATAIPVLAFHLVESPMIQVGRMLGRRKTTPAREKQIAA